MPDEPTPGELRRSLADVREDLRERYAAVNQRIDTMVPAPVFNAHTAEARREHDDLAKDIAAVLARVEADQRQRSADRRLVFMALFTSIIAPLLLLVLSIYLRGQSAGP